MAERFCSVCERPFAHRRERVERFVREEVEDAFDRPGLARGRRALDREGGEAVEQSAGDREIDQLAEWALSDDTSAVELALEEVEDARLLREDSCALPGGLRPDLGRDPIVFRVRDRGLEGVFETLTERVPILEIEVGDILRVGE